MELQNTLENKAKVFALYWGQQVMNHVEYMYETPCILSYACFLDVALPKIFLQLKPISSISDEDYFAIVQNEIMNPSHIDDEIDVTYGKLGNITLSDVTTIDYLRSKGYALPAFGLSVEELVNRGWYVLEK